MDYRDMKVLPDHKPDGMRPMGTATPGFWWQEQDATARAGRVSATGMELKNQQMSRKQMNLHHARLYGNYDIRSFDAATYNQNLVLMYDEKIALNVVAACTDTLTSKIAKSKPKPSFQTNGASWAMQQKARNLDKFMRGVFYETKAYSIAPKCFQAACIFGTGAIKVFIDSDSKRLKLEHTFIDEIYVDDVDGKYGAPRQLLQRKLVQKDVLLATLGKDLTEEQCHRIMGAGTPGEASTSMKPLSNVVEVWEAWHLPSSSESKDGWHSIVVADVELVGEKWEHDFFPFVFLRFSNRVLGFWGQGVAERLSGIQVELNRLIRSVSEQLRRKGRGRIMVPIGTKIVPEQLTNGVADIVRYSGGVAPVVDNNNAVAPEEFMQIERLRQFAFQEIGMSELSVAAKKPSGLDAAVAMREFNDIESERFADLQNRWDQMFLDLAEICIAMVAAQGGRGYKQRLPNKRFIVELDWADIGLERDDFIMQMFPASSLPTTPAARYQRVKEMMQDGFIDKAVAQRLLDFPDIEAEENLGNAAIDDVDCVIGYILDAETPKLLLPDEFQNLDLLVQRGTAALLYAKHHGADEERLDMLRELITAAGRAKVSMMPPPPPAPGPDMGAAPPAGGPPMPGGPMVPNVDINMPVQPAVPPLVAS